MKMPDLETWDLGKWDDTDFEINKYFLSVKSTKAFGNLLLLETKDWNENGEYIPNLAINGAHSLYDFFILVRISPYCEDMLKQHKMLFSNEVDKENLKDILINQTPTWHRGRNLSRKSRPHEPCVRNQKQCPLYRASYIPC
jgi:hypothetical protein